ncbi:MAG: DUF2911 domain-containing protein [Cyclobacteriaceae bacterium]
MYRNNTLFRALLSGSFVLIAIYLLSGCSSDKNKRPSPAAYDSLVTATYIINIEYSSPRVKKRKIWGELVPYNSIWRTGANKATYFKSTSDLFVEGELLEAGTYSIFTIPRENEPWTIIFNKEWDQWGSYNYDETLDALRLEVMPVSSDFNEKMTFKLEESSLRFEWEKLAYELDLSVYE